MSIWDFPESVSRQFLGIILVCYYCGVCIVCCAHTCVFERYGLFENCENRENNENRENRDGGR